MNNLLCHPGRTFTLDGLVGQTPVGQTKAARESTSRKLTDARSIFYINLDPISDPSELEFLAGLAQFERIPDNLLFKLVRVATGYEVRDRWIAVRAIIAKRIPIPVSKPLPEMRHG